MVGILVVIKSDVSVSPSGSGKVCTAFAFPRVAPGSENTASGVRQHSVFSLLDSQQKAPGST
jgi:hypothetical protein